MPGTYLILLIVFLLAARWTSGPGYLQFLPHAVQFYPSSSEEADEVVVMSGGRSEGEEKLFVQTDESVVYGFDDILEEPGDEISSVAGSVNPAILIMKLLVNRPRPYQVAPNINHVLLGSATAATPAFPSGHSTQAYYVALHYAQIHPTKRESLMQRADDIGMSRVKAGLHYPSDHKAGRKLALFLHNINANKKTSFSA